MDDEDTLYYLIVNGSFAWNEDGEIMTGEELLCKYIELFKNNKRK